MTRPLTSQPDTCSQGSLAATSDGFLLAYWNDGLNILRLDRSLTAIAAPRLISPRGHLGTCPAAAARDGRVVLAWKQSPTHAVVALLAANGSLDGPQSLAANLSPASRLLAAAGADSDWIASDSDLFQISHSTFALLAPIDPIGHPTWASTPPAAFRATETHGTYDSIAMNGASVVTTAHAFGEVDKQCRAGAFTVICAGPFPFASLAYSEGILSREIWLLGQPIPTRSATACVNGDCAIAWFDRASPAGLRQLLMKWSTEPVAFHSIGQPAFPSGRAYEDAEIAAASSEDRVLFVWQTFNGNRYEIAGVELTRTSIGQPFVIASGEGDRVKPSVIAIAGSLFVVSYEIPHGSTTEIGMRYVDLDPPVRRRIAR